MANTEVQVILNAKDNASKVLGNVATSVKSLSVASLAAGAAFVGVLGAGFVVAGKRAIDVAGDLQSIELALETLTGSAELAAKAMEGIKQDAAKTPFDLREVAKANQMLISTGLGAEQSRKAVLDLGNAIVATGGGNAEFSRMIGNLQQIRNVGKATEMDIRQFGFAGINIYALLAKSTGKSIEQLKEMDISYDMLTKSLSDAAGAGGMFGGALEKQGNSWNLLKSNLTDVVNIMLADIATNTGVFGFLNDQLKSLVNFLAANKDKVVGFFIVLGNVITSIVGMLRGADLKAELSEALSFFVSGSNPSELADKLASGIAMVVEHLRRFGEWVYANREYLGEFFKNLAIAIAALAVVAAIAFGALIAGITAVIIIYQRLQEAFQTYVQVMFDALREKITEAIAKFVEIKDAIVLFFTEVGVKLTEAKEQWLEFWNSILEMITGVINFVKTILNMSIEDWAFYLGFVAGAVEAWIRDIDDNLKEFGENFTKTSQEFLTNTGNSWNNWIAVTKVNIKNWAVETLFAFIDWGTRAYAFLIGIIGSIKTYFSQVVEKDWVEIFRTAVRTIISDVTGQFTTMKENVLGVINDIVEGINGMIGKIGKAIEKFKEGRKLGLKLNFQTGGIVPGPIGQPVPIMAHAGERVVPVSGGGGGGGGGAGVAVHLHVGNFVGTQTELRNFAKDIYAQLVVLAQSQNKSVVELMGA